MNTNTTTIETIPSSLSTSTSTSSIPNNNNNEDEITENISLVRTLSREQNRPNIDISNNTNLLNLDSSNKNYVLDIFSKTAMMVCEGQQMDMDYENMNNPGIDQYLEMIKLKTSVLLAASFQIGALIGGASKTDALLLYEFGINLGIAFQIQDDLLDLYGNKSKFGKNVGGDIIANKKTFLYLKSLSIANSTQRRNLLNYYINDSLSSDEKIRNVRFIFDELNIYGITKDLISSYHDKAISCLNSIVIEKNESLNYFASLLLKREV